MFRADCKMENQSQSFSDVGTKHQNAMAERAIQTIIYMARTFIVHVSLHWSERGANDFSSWGLAIKHAAYTIIFQAKLQGLLHWNCSPKPRLIIRTCCVHMCGVVQFLFLTPNCRMVRKSLSGIDGFDWANLWISQMSSHP